VLLPGQVIEDAQARQRARERAVESQRVQMEAERRGHLRACTTVVSAQHDLAEQAARAHVQMHGSQKLVVVQSGQPDLRKVLGCTQCHDYLIMDMAENTTLIVSGCSAAHPPNEQMNGHFHLDMDGGGGLRNGKPCFRKSSADLAIRLPQTISFSDGYWQMSVEQGLTLYQVQSDAAMPPTAGWAVGAAGFGLPPQLLCEMRAGTNALPPGEFPVDTLQFCLFTPDVQWQSRGKRRIFQGCSRRVA